MTVTGVKSVTMVNFYHISVAAAVSGPDDDAQRSRRDASIPRGTAEIDAGMKSDMACEGVDAGAEPLLVSSNCWPCDRRGQQHMAERRK